ncbi:MAG TPA: DUF4476 domain-containing protein [Chitinophagaceae bacterium]|jgi:Domain of unknown function (DUF4476)|nr:DUF4476 domain-containing protein [Chitinophagaceae bacterium]
MKKIFTLGFSALISLGSFAQGGHGRIVFSSQNRSMQVTVSDNRFGRRHDNVQPDRYNSNDRGWNNDNSRRDYHNYNDNDHFVNNSVPFYKNVPHNDYVHNNGHFAYGGYSNIISDQDFFAAERVMDRENDNGRLIYAERLVDEYCLNAEQVKDLARFFSFDNCRFEFVKYAYSKTTDRGNFSIVCNAFLSSDGRGQVMNFIRSCN